MSLRGKKNKALLGGLFLLLLAWTARSSWGGKSLTLDWEALPGALRYETEVQASPVKTPKTYFSTQPSVHIPFVPGSYSYRVRAWDAFQRPGLWTAWTPFQIPEPPARLPANSSPPPPPPPTPVRLLPAEESPFLFKKSWPAPPIFWDPECLDLSLGAESYQQETQIQSDNTRIRAQAWATQGGLNGLFSLAPWLQTGGGITGTSFEIDHQTKTTVEAEGLLQGRWIRTRLRLGPLQTIFKGFLTTGLEMREELSLSQSSSQAFWGSPLRLRIQFESVQEYAWHSSLELGFFYPWGLLWNAAPHERILGSDAANFDNISLQWKGGWTLPFAPHWEIGWKLQTQTRSLTTATSSAKTLQRDSQLFGLSLRYYFLRSK